MHLNKYVPITIPLAINTSNNAILTIIFLDFSTLLACESRNQNNKQQKQLKNIKELQWLQWRRKATQQLFNRKHYLCLDRLTNCLPPASCLHAINRPTISHRPISASVHRWQLVKSNWQTQCELSIEKIKILNFCFASKSPKKYNRDCATNCTLVIASPSTSFWLLFWWSCGSFGIQCVHKRLAVGRWVCMYACMCAWAYVFAAVFVCLFIVQWMLELLLKKVLTKSTFNLSTANTAFT